jgi:Enoyl-(Acyl carrier protein) reductase
MLERIGAGRFGALDDLIGATVFLCSDAARYVTGQLLYIDGGIWRRCDGLSPALLSGQVDGRGSQGNAA